MQIGFATQDPRSPYWMIVGYAVRERAAELGIAITTLSTAASGEQEQIAAINTFVEERVDALVVGPVVARGLAPAIERALAARIPVIVVASPLLDCTVTCTVQSNHAKGATLAATYMVEQLGGAGAVAHLIGPLRLQDNVDRATAIRTVLGQHPGVQIVFEQESPDWEAASGAALMRAVLDKHPYVQGVCVANDTLALGAVAAIEAAGRTGQIVVTGFDGTPDALRAIHQGRLSATVHQSIREIGRAAVDQAQRATRGEAVPQSILIDVALVTRATLLDAALDAVYILPNVLADTIARTDELARARDEMIQAQELALRELSSPCIPISDTVMVLPLIGAINARRAQQIIETLLAGIAAHRTQLVIIDITGVPLVDTQVANVLILTAQAVKLLGAEVVLTGIRPEVAQTLVGLGVDLGGIITRSTLQDAIAYGLRGHSNHLLPRR